MDKKNLLGGSASGMFFGSIPTKTNSVEYRKISTLDSENKKYNEIVNPNHYYFFKFKKNINQENTLNFKLEPKQPKANDMVKIANDNAELNVITKDEYNDSSEKSSTGCIIS